MTTSILYSCPFVPPEWIAAHGLVPCRVLPAPHPGAGVLTGRQGVCPFARAFVEDVCAREAVGIVVTTLCDQMRRAAEIIARHAPTPVFLLNVPATWQHPATHRLYREELQRLGRFLLQVGGREPEPAELVRVMLEHEDGRPRARPTATAQPVPLALLGGPLRQPDLAVFDLVAQLGGRIVLDATDTGIRTQPRRFDRRLLRDDPTQALAELADAYFGTIPHPYRRPNTALYQWLRRELPAHHVRGVLMWRYVWCDLWHAESQRLQDFAGVPVLDLEVGDEGDSVNRIPGRIQAFLEMLR